MLFLFKEIKLVWLSESKGTTLSSHAGQARQWWHRALIPEATTVRYSYIDWAVGVHAFNTITREEYKMRGYRSQLSRSLKIMEAGLPISSLRQR